MPVIRQWEKTVCLCDFHSPAMLSVACISGGVLCTVFSVSWSSKHRNRSLLAQFQPFKTDALAFIFTVVLSSYTQSIHATQNTKHSIVFHRCRILFFFSVSFFCGLQKRLDFFSLVRSVGFALLFVSCLSCYCLSCCIKHFSIRNFLHFFRWWMEGTIETTATASSKNDGNGNDGDENSYKNLYAYLELSTWRAVLVSPIGRMRCERLWYGFLATGKISIICILHATNFEFVARYMNSW